MMNRLLCILLALVCACAGATESTGANVNATFTPLSVTGSILTNPFRGVFIQTSPCCGTASQSMLDTVGTYSTNSGDYSGGNGGLLCTIDALPYVGGHITTAALNNLQANFNAIRNAGMWCMTLVGYNIYNAVDGGQTITDVVTHAADLQPYFHANADIIPYGRAGFIGFYGQWFGATTANGNTLACGYSAANACPGTATIIANQKTARDAILQMYDPRTIVGWPGTSEPLYWYGTTPLAATDAFSGSAQSRITMDDDCMLSGFSSSTISSTAMSIDDYGQFTDAYGSGLSVAQANSYWHQAMEFLGMGGEMDLSCGSGSGNAQFTTCAQALIYYPYFHLNWLKFITARVGPWSSGWASGGCTNQILNSAGYRIQLDSISHQGTAVHGQSVTATVALRNIGWSRASQPSKLTLTLISGSNVVTCQSRVDIRALPDQATASFTVQIGGLVPCTIPTAGTYTVYLSIPPIWPSLVGKPAYYVQPANANTGSQTYNSSSGSNLTGTISTGTTIVVS